MDLIKKNPFRITGIISNASQREIVRQQGKVKAFARVGRAIESEYDFAILGEITRTEALINKAFSSIEQNGDKVHYALFWFLNVNAFDKTAIDYLKKGDSEKAIEIWEKVTDRKELTSKNFSSFSNLATLKLLGRRKKEFVEGIEGKLKLIESSAFVDFVHTVTDQVFKVSSEVQLRKFTYELLQQLENKLSVPEIVAIFSNCSVKTKKYIAERLCHVPIRKVEIKIENTKKNRELNRTEAYNLGQILIEEIDGGLADLETLLGKESLKYKTLVDSLAKEILQCGIDYFNEFKDVKDPSKGALKLLKKAKSIVLKGSTKARIKENIEGIKQWAEAEPIKEDLAFITGKLETFQSSNDTISNAKSLVSSCKSRLQNIRNILGSTDELYLNISSAVVNNALGMVIEVVNEAQSGLEYNTVKLIRLPDIVSEAVSAISAMDSLDMDRQTWHRYSENKSTISGIHDQLKNVRRQTRPSSSSSSSGGCYIATMAYGDYDHPQVLVLRRFRDDFLSKTVIGRSFIKFYYRYSPILVEKLENKQSINLIIRKGLDQFIKAIKK